jgi:hypothetical protein
MGVTFSGEMRLVQHS